MTKPSAPTVRPAADGSLRSLWPLTFQVTQASQQGTIFGVATQHLLHLAADRRVYLMLILHLRVSSSDSSEVERLASILGDPRSIPPISKNIFVGNWAWFGLAILLSNSASSQNKAPCWEVCSDVQFALSEANWIILDYSTRQILAVLQLPLRE